jgi:hypothetical protein
LGDFGCPFFWVFFGFLGFFDGAGMAGNCAALIFGSG